jgi:hypothetical protein
MTPDFPSGICCLTTLLLLTAATPGYSQQPVASFYYDERGSVTRQEQDTNRDGKMDRWIYYDSNGQMQRVEQDVNFDGKPDTIVYYESGRPVRQEVASKNDGQIDTWLYLNSKGEVERKGQDTNHAGQPCGYITRMGSRCGAMNRALTGVLDSGAFFTRMARLFGLKKTRTEMASPILFLILRTANWFVKRSIANIPAKSTFGAIIRMAA